MTITCTHGKKPSADCISVLGLCYNALNTRNVQTFLEPIERTTRCRYLYTFSTGGCFGLAGNESLFLA